MEMNFVIIRAYGDHYFVGEPAPLARENISLKCKIYFFECAKVQKLHILKDRGYPRQENDRK